MKKVRLFVALNLPRDFKDEFARVIGEFKPLFYPQIRFLQQSNWHITVSFLGEQDYVSVPAICEAIKETAAQSHAPYLQFQNISYGPVGGRGDLLSVRMIWANGSEKSSLAIGAIKRILEDKLSERRISFANEYRRFHAHITIARFEAAPRSSLPVIDRQFGAEAEIKSLDLMESRLSSGGADYSLLTAFDFKK